MKEEEEREGSSMHFHPSNISSHVEATAGRMIEASGWW